MKKDKERPASSINGRAAEVATNDSSSLDTNKDSNSASEVRVDEEGYIIPPHLATDASKKEPKFYSDSDTSDDEDGPKKPIHVVIKPINSISTSSIKGTGSIQELKETVQGLSLSSLTTSVSL